MTQEFRPPSIRVVASNRMPHDIYLACEATGTISASVYIQHAVCEALARDLHLPLDMLLAALPPPKGNAATLFGVGGHARHGGTKNEEVV